MAMALPQTSISPAKCRQSETDFISSYLRGPKAGQRPETFNVVKLTHEELRPFSTLCIWKISNWGITIELLGRLNFFCIQVQRSQIYFYSGKNRQQQNTSNPCGMQWNESVLYVWEKWDSDSETQIGQWISRISTCVCENSRVKYPVSCSFSVPQRDPTKIPCRYT